MDKKKQLRVLWIANSPGLSAGHLKMNVAGSGWIPALQEALGQFSDCQLGLAFYFDRDQAPFELHKTWFFPVKKLGNTRKKRFLNRLKRQAEYEENIPAFLQVIEDFKPDIIHVHGTEAPFGLIVKRIVSIPVVISIQGILTAYEKKYFSGMNMPGLIRQIRSGYPFFRADYAIWLKRAKIEQEILGHTEFIFGRTDWDRRVCRAMAPQARYYHVEEVIRKEFYQIKWKATGNAVPVLFTTSSPSLYKGFENVIDTAAILLKSGVSFTWLVAGLKEEDALVKLIKWWKGVDDLASLHIRLVGTLSEKELPGYLLQSDLYIQVSHIENSPNSLCEAMLAGMPIIASFAGGTASLLQDKVHGLLFQDGDPYMLAGCIDEMLNAPGLAHPMAEAAYREAHRRHDAKSVVGDMLQKYTVIIEEKQAAGRGRENGHSLGK
jgi:glycosyltransferase involved in cell wall biosynthesis